MTWVKTSDTFIDWGVWEKLGPAPYFLHMAALSHCNRQGSDGLLTRGRALTLTPVVPDAANCMETLLAAGVWRLIDVDTIQVAEYVPDLRSNGGRGDEQPSSAALQAKRDADAERLRKWRAKRDAQRKAEAEAKAKGNGVSSPVANPDLTWPDLAEGQGQVGAQEQRNAVSPDVPVYDRPECQHGMAGGYDRLPTGHSRCPMCRLAERIPA